MEDLLDSLQSLTPGNRRKRQSATVPAAQAIAFHGKVRLSVLLFAERISACCRCLAQRTPVRESATGPTQAIAFHGKVCRRILWFASAASHTSDVNYFLFPLHSRYIAHAPGESAS